MRFFVTINGKEREVVAKSHETGYKLHVDKKEFAVDFRRIANTNTYSLLVDGKSFAITSIPEGKELVLKTSGETFRAEVQSERERAANLISGRTVIKGPMTMNAVMPGFVTRVLVSPGDSVEIGQPLLVIEAMKMQNEMTADVQGVVREVHVEADQTVRGGDPLVTIEIE